MRNATEPELAALRALAARVAAPLPPVQRGADGKLTPESRDALGRACEGALRRHRAVGAAIALCAPGGATDILCFGRARLRPCAPVTARTCFRLASVSKLLLSFAALSLCEEGRLSLDEEAGAYLGYPVRSPRHASAPVTLRMLLTHTAALRDGGPYARAVEGEPLTLRALLEDEGSWLPARPGERFAYCNLSAAVAGAAVERAGGAPLSALLRERIFLPLGARAYGDPRDVSPASDLACGYAVRGWLPPRLRYDAARLAAREKEPFDPERDYLAAAGRAIADADGLARLGRLLASHGAPGVLSGASLDEIRRCQDGTGGVERAGRGLNVGFLPGVFPGFSPVGHQGVAYGMCAELFADPATGSAVGIMTSGVRLTRAEPLAHVGLELLALGFAALRGAQD